MFGQISTFLDNLFLKIQKQISEGPLCLKLPFNIARKMEICVDKRNLFGALLTDYSKTFYCLDH